MALIPLDGSRGEGGGQVLRTALTLSAVTGQGFEITQIRARRTRPGLRPQHVAAVRAVAMACDAKTSGLFEGSPDLRFEPGKANAGDFRFEIGTAGASSLVLQTVLPVLATADAESRCCGAGRHPRARGARASSICPDTGRRWFPASAFPLVTSSCAPASIPAGEASCGRSRAPGLAPGRPS